MPQPYVGEIRLFAGNFAPAGWQLCEGQLLPISENETLFQLIGTTYGGDGQSTFALPDMRGRIPVHQGPGFVLSQTGGAEEVTLTLGQIPAHTHVVAATANAGSSSSPQSNLLATAVGNIYFPGPGGQTLMSGSSVSSAGGSQPHSNMQPYVCVNYIISLFGIFPSPT